MDERRLIITDYQWAKMEPQCLGRKQDPGRTGSDPQMFLEAVLWIARTGAPWRDLPPANSASGTRSTAGSGIGRGPVFSSVYSMRCPRIPTWRWR